MYHVLTTELRERLHAGVTGTELKKHLLELFRAGNVVKHLRVIPHASPGGTTAKEDGHLSLLSL